MCRDIFNLIVNKYYTDTDGVIINKNTLPANLQTSCPVFIAYYNDFVGGYFQFLKNEPINGWVYFLSYVEGRYDYLNKQGFVNINANIPTGSLVHVFTDSAENPNYYCFVIQSGDVAPVSFYSTLTGVLFDGFKYYCDNNLQFNQSIDILKGDRVGRVAKEIIQPNSFKPATQNSVLNFIDIKVKLLMSDFVGISIPLDFTTDKISLNINFYG